MPIAARDEDVDDEMIGELIVTLVDALSEEVEVLGHMELSVVLWVLDTAIDLREELEDVELLRPFIAPVIALLEDVVVLIEELEAV